MYTIDLYNYDFDKDNMNVRLFDDVESRELYFDNNSLFTFNKNVNFPANDLITTQVVLDYSEYEDNLVGLLNCNYMRVKNKNNTMYFWIEKSTQLAGYRISLQARIDEFQTYFYDLEFSDCIIKRAHLDRFIDDSLHFGKYEFNYLKNSELFKNENIGQPAQRLIAREKLKLIYDNNSNSPFNKFLNDNVKCWCYLYLNSETYKILANADYDLSKISYRYVSDKTSNFNAQTGATAVICFPILKEGYEIQLEIFDAQASITYNCVWNFESIRKFLNKNDGNSKVFTIKYSALAPFNVDVDYSSKYEISNDESTMTIKASTLTSGTPAYIRSEIYDDNCFVPVDSTGLLLYSICHVTGQWLRNVKCQINLQEIIQEISQVNFSTNDIKQNSNSLEPKIFAQPLTKFVLSQIGNRFEYDLQKLHFDELNFYYFEALTPDNTKALVVYNPANNQGFYTVEESRNFSGLISTQDNSVLFSSDKLDEFLANNKNFYLSFLSNNITNSIKGLLTSFKSLDPLTFGFNVAGSTVDLANNFLNTSLSIDNLKNAPDIIKNANGNAMFCGAVTDFAPYVEIYQICDADKKTILDYFNEFGYKFAEHDNISNHLRTRKIFNYIEADIENIIGNLSENVKSLIREKLKRGVRFWHINEIDFSLQNYETYFDEE